ncbi:RNA-binding domain-containing protein [Microcoleus sp. MON2_D5]|uniref:RNA-binding domain-containing protein n=1 Tax=Microcoleus sp. MON2_D5 TaxID=2818833 RepID=UPI002FD2B015
MPNPKEVFDCPLQYWTFLTSPTDSQFEGQYFDRKEAGRREDNGCVSKGQIKTLLDQITECISAFANTDGGLLVLGISQTGEVKGTNHLNENQINQITNINKLLVSQSAVVKFYECQDASTSPNKICLIYVPGSERGICETLESPPKAWRRYGFQNLCLTDEQKERLRRDKKIVDFERQYCCSYNPDELDRGVLNEFRQVFLKEAEYNYDDDQLLYEAGALIKDGSNYAFTNAGLLFFAANPQRVMPWCYIRLLRFEVVNEDRDRRRLPTFEKKFSGSLTKQIRNLRTFFQESAFFKLYQRRNIDGGFTEEPEYPYLAIDEAIVNAVVHRDHAVRLPIECESYKDAFVVRNPGRILQRDHEVPSQFTLANTILNSTPRNSKLIEWLKIMRDQRGAAFVRALSEGTKQMRDQMDKLSLPAPSYKVNQAETTLILYNNSAEREAKFAEEAVLEYSKFTNLFPLSFNLENGESLDRKFLDQRQKDIMLALKDALLANGWYIDSLKFGSIVTHYKGAHIPQNETMDKIVRFYQSYSFQLRRYYESYYICINPKLEVKNIQNILDLLTDYPADFWINKTALARWQGSWYYGKIISISHEWTNLYLFDFDKEEQVCSQLVIPDIPLKTLEEIIKKKGINFNFSSSIRELSLSAKPGSARIRAEKTMAIAKQLYQTIFKPLVFGGISISMKSSPLLLSERKRSPGLPNRRSRHLEVNSLLEPSVEFHRRQEAVDIREGITKFGAYSSEPKNIEIVPICPPNYRKIMGELIERLKTGKYKYRGSERTFSTRFTYNSIITPPSPESTLDECKRLLSEHSNWIADESLSRILLIYTPKGRYSIDDENSPYYQLKRFLLEQGIPCQMLDTPTLEKPDWKDLNLALNLVAKCGLTPWVLPDAIPDADFLVGLSYTQESKGSRGRLMGYANVFNQYGRWEFYCGNTETFPYEDRSQYFEKLILQTFERLELSETPHIYFHYSAKFSKDDRAAILKAARLVRPQGTYSFVWINTHHNVRLYDSRVETDGSLSRGSYVITSPNQFYLSTTGYNPYRKILGTPKPLEINIWIEYPESMPTPPPDLKAIAVQILSLTKLNWGSTDSICAEPITTKYAGDIAYLTAAFLRQSNSFALHPVLENTPWFI